MLLYEHISVQIWKNLQKCFHTLRSFHRNRINCFLEYSSSDLHSPIRAKRAHPPGGNRHTHPYVYGQARLLYALWRAGGLHRCEISPPQSTIFSLMSLRQPFLPGVDASSCDRLYNSPLSKTPQKAASSLSATLALADRISLPASHKPAQRWGQQWKLF